MLLKVIAALPNDSLKTIDIAADWGDRRWVVEVGDGQVSDVRNMDVTYFYKTLCSIDASVSENERIRREESINTITLHRDDILEIVKVIKDNHLISDKLKCVIDRIHTKLDNKQ